MKTLFIIGSIAFLTACCSTKKATSDKITETVANLDKRCYIEPDGGKCRAAIPRYYFDSIDNKCKQFTWGGCQGIVPFNTIEECMKACGCDSSKLQKK